MSDETRPLDSNFASNIELFKQIAFEQPEFWAHLKLVAKHLAESKCFYWDEHNGGAISDEPITHLAVVQYFNDDGTVRTKTRNPDPYNNGEHPIAWVTPFYCVIPAGSICRWLRKTQCMNSLFIWDGNTPKVTLSTYATGTMVREAEFDKLVSGEVLNYPSEHPFPAERQYVIPIADFLRILG